MRWCVLAAACVMVLPALAQADLCPQCKDKMFTADIGTCACGADTSSGAFKLCPKCSQKLKQCQACRAALGGKPAEGGQPRKDDPAAPSGGPRRKPLLSGPIRLIDRPVGRVVGDCLVLSREDVGMTARVSVGQAIILQLAGDKTSGWEWKLNQCTSEAVQAVGEPRRKETPVEEGMLGGSVIFLFPFKAARTGQATLLMEGGRPWDWEKKTTQTLKFHVLVQEEPKVLTEARRKEMQAEMAGFKLSVRFYGPAGEAYRSLVLTTAEADKPADERTTALKISHETAQKILDHLAECGYLAAAIDRAKEREPVYKEPCYVLDAAGGKLLLRGGLGWEKATMDALAALARTLDGPTAQALQTLMDGLKEEAKLWEKDAAAATTAPGAAPQP